MESSKRHPARAMFIGLGIGIFCAVILWLSLVRWNDPDAPEGRIRLNLQKLERVERGDLVLMSGPGGWKDRVVRVMRVDKERRVVSVGGIGMQKVTFDFEELAEYTDEVILGTDEKFPEYFDRFLNSWDDLM